MTKPPTVENVQYSVGKVEHTRVQPDRQETKQPISMYITTVLYFMIKILSWPEDSDTRKT